jgi:ParB family chromosome partitioning protein
LKQNLAQNPLAQPVVVIRLPDGTLELVAGYNRCQIYEELGREEIEVAIRDLKDSEIVKAAVYSNLLVTALPDYEKYTNLKLVFENTQATHEEISADSGITRSKVQRLMRFDELPEKALEAIAVRPECIGDDTVENLRRRLLMANRSWLSRQQSVWPWMRSSLSALQSHG